MSQNVENRSNESVESLREPAENCSSHLQVQTKFIHKVMKKKFKQ